MRPLMGSLIGLDVEVNGVPMGAVLDTGSRRMIVSEAGAEVADVRLGNASTDEGRGIGTQRLTSRPARFDLTVGGTQLGELRGEATDLPVFRVLGFDGPVVLLGTPAIRGCLLHISYERDELRFCSTPQRSSP